MTSITSLATSFARAQKAAGRSPHTIKLYSDCLKRLIAVIGDDLENFTRRTITDYLAMRSETVAAATAWTDYKVVRVFSRWLVDEEDLDKDPMARMKPPRTPIVPVPVLSDADISRLLLTCTGKTQRDRRDLALIRLALDSGARRGEMAGLQVEDLDLDSGLVRVTGKGRTRVVPIGSRTVQALDRHLRASPTTGSVFGLTPSGLSQAFKERAKSAGMPTVHLHQTRHTWAHRLLAAGAGETDAMTLGGWAPGSRSILDRYGASGRVQRAIATHRRLALGDQF